MQTEKRSEQDDELAEDVKNLRFLVLDEADRMVEIGHFAELDNILKLTQRQFQYVSYLPFVRRTHSDQLDVKGGL